MINVHEVVETNGLVFDCVTDEHSITVHDKAMKAACDSAYDDEVAAARRPPSDEHRVRHIATDAFGSITALRPNGVMAMSPRSTLAVGHCGHWPGRRMCNQEVLLEVRVTPIVQPSL